MSFSAQLQAFVKGSQERIDKTVKGATVALARNIISETPVDTGAAKGNWQAGVGAPKTGTVDRQDSSGQQAIADITSTIPNKAGGVVYLSNNLPYINKLEYGHSKQAPAGMTRVNAAKWPHIVNAEAAKHK